MNYQVKLFSWQNNGPCLIIMTQGRMDRSAILRVVNEIIEATKALEGCKILIDFQNTICDFGRDDLFKLKVELDIYRQTAMGNLRLAMVTARIPEQYDRLSLLKTPVSQLGIDVGVFYEERWAIDWLVEEPSQRVS
jgi:hypothetical protein